MINLDKYSSATVLLVCCIICMILTSASDLCPENMRDTCEYTAGVLNCILCIVVFAHMMGIFKK